MDELLHFKLTNYYINLLVTRRVEANDGLLTKGGIINGEDVC